MIPSTAIITSQAAPQHLDTIYLLSIESLAVDINLVML